ncbi:lipoate--protein ligase [Candidatus Phytoplasma pini]|uniref:lipoate--protein ligase n=1 Tax=Candidatus Phytoplasma pini TaxID=267362 RepID=A0A559KJG6_9MOLU|nr:lipoate--protein ligase [Candidatus Phytoplasma pini]TVY12260.1 Lipoate-protein ligase A [Candidatus Phytoplasma pini]
MILVKCNHSESLKPYFYFALEEYFLNNFLNKNEIFFFLWKIHGVVIGKNQIIENEVNLDFLRENKIDIFRRPTGGGCVYNDPQTPLFSIITKKKDKDFSFKKYLVHIIEAFKKLGIDLYFSGRNDILLNGKKVSGSSFMENKNGMIMHGTLLYNCDIPTMIRCITPNDEKLISKGIESVSSRVTNLKKYLNKDITQEKLMTYLENFLTNRIYILSEEEISKIKNMALKYSNKEWIYGEHPFYTKNLKQTFDWGCLEILLSLRKGKIEKIFLRGDFFHKKEENGLFKFTNYFENILYNQEEIKKILEHVNINDYILNAKNEDFLTLLTKGMIYL